ncbi:MAG: hypothetical protein L0211_03080 [Planctomycetaceae bacterium]|nr:hypothetical protein [Planctomycetaceae bacterium]
MRTPEHAAGGSPALEQVLGYLNFSSGAADPQFLANLNALFEAAAGQNDGLPHWLSVSRMLTDRLRELEARSPAFHDAQQATAVLQLVFDRTLPSYREFHRDLLFHHSDVSLFRPLFVGRVCEAVLRQGPPWNEPERIVTTAIGQLNDFLGHRPVATLESQRVEPYRHEFVRPIPLYIRGAGITFGPEREVVAAALKLLDETDPELLRQACYCPENLDELAVDPRAYDFDHPANKRPNYHFGQWDPHQIDNQGRYRRFVVQQVTLDALMRRLVDVADIPYEELLFEAASVLAGTILMASGISGDGPATFDSTVTLSKLLPKIARYRDDFYQRLFQRVSGEHAERLRIEAAEKRQPFGGARQHLNAQLARQRASQLEHVHLARIFARMGHTEAARREADVVPCASARMLCQIDCLMTSCQLACTGGKLEEAAGLLSQLAELLKRGIQCGAIIDPWNILGFDAHFSLFPSLENSVRDHRADELVATMDRLWALYSQAWSAAAASDHKELSKKVSRQFKEIATWWHKFAVHEVSSVEAVDSLVVYRAAERVVQALNVWHKGGAATGDVAFWQPHAEMFDSPKAYALVIEALLDRRDYVASMALLIHWVGQAGSVGLERADASLHDLAQRWLGEMTSLAGADSAGSARSWDTARKFLDYLEANADQFWNVPVFSLGNHKSGNSQRGNGADPLGEDDDGERFDAAYEGVVFRDSTDDGVEGSIFETDEGAHDELVSESRRLADRLLFLSTVARLWKLAATSPALRSVSAPDSDSEERTARAGALHRWIEQAEQNRADLENLLAAIRDYKISQSTGQHDSNVEYDRRRMTKESLLERVIATSVEMADATRLLQAAVALLQDCPEHGEPGGERQLTIAIFAALLRQDASAARDAAGRLCKLLVGQPLLYVPLAKGGNPDSIVGVRVRQHAIQDLLAWLPRLGLWVETCELLEVARTMEREHPVGPGAVTEFDELFKIGYRSIVECLVASSAQWPAAQEGEDDESHAESVVSCLEKLTESLLSGWLAHSRTLRLSVLERVHDKANWKKLVEFVERYGDELFTQRFLNLGNIRAILHQGVGHWITRLQEEEQPDDAPERLLGDLAAGEPLDAAAEQLSLVLEAVVENYGEYRDYNSTTTQSDKGGLLYMLLDFLRLRTRYDRVCWNLKPVVLAHEILVRRDQDDAARIWRRALTERINDEADQYLAKLAELQKKYAMRMPTVADRLAERFVRPLAIDRIRALVAPAIDEAQSAAKDCPKFEMLKHDTEYLTREPTGVGLDVPAWLVALEEEVEQALRPEYQRRQDDELSRIVPLVVLSQQQARKQLDDWATRQT